MKTIGEDVGRRVMALIVACVIVSLVTAAFAQDVTITSPDQLAQVALSANYSIYLPFSPWDWRAYPTDWPLWCDFTQMACLDSLPTSTNFMTSMDWSSVPLASVILTKDVLSGVTTVQSSDSTDVVATIPAPSGYQPGAAPEDHWLWDYYVQATNNPDAWGLTPDQIPPPTITLRTFLADSNAYYSVYQTNLQAEAAAAAAATVASAPSFLGDFLAMDEEADFSGDPCTIPDDTIPFRIVSIAPDGGGSIVLQWQSCTDHVYVVQTESSLTPTSSWRDVGWMFGSNQTTSWPDTNAAGLAQNFYQVVRANPTNLNNGVPYGWAVTYGLDPLDPNLASEDPTGDGYDNYMKYLTGGNPYEAYLDIVVNNGNPYTASQVIPIDPLSTSFPDILISTDPFMSNAVLYANNGNIQYTLANTTNPQMLYLQYASGPSEGQGPTLTKVVTLDTNAPVVAITSPASNTVLNQAFITLQAVAYDPDPLWTDDARPLQIWINGQPYYDRSGTNIYIERYPVPPGTNSFTVTILVANQAGTTNQATQTWAVNTSTATNAPNLLTVNLSSTMLLPSVNSIWVEGTVDNDYALVNAIVTSLATGDVSTNALAVRQNQYEGLVPLESGTNQLVLVAANAAGRASSNAFTLISSTEFSAAITNPVFDVYATTPSNYVSGYVSKLFDAGLPTQTNVVGVLINGVAAVVNWNHPDSIGNVRFTTTNMVPSGIPITGQVLIAGHSSGSQQADSGPTSPPITIPPVQSQTYEVLHWESHSDMMGDLYDPAFKRPCYDWQTCQTNCSGSDWCRVLTRTTVDDVLDIGAGEQYENVEWEVAGNPCTSDPNPVTVSYTTYDSSQSGCAGTNGASPAMESADAVNSCSVNLPRSLSFGTTSSDGGVNFISSCFCWGWGCPYDTEGTETYRNRQRGTLTFRPPRAYGTNTVTVIFTFEGMDYRWGVGNTGPLDLSQVNYRGQSPYSFDNAAQTVSYKITVTGGREYTINQDSFGWPGGSAPRQTSAYGNWPYVASDSYHYLTFTNFHNLFCQIAGPTNVCVSYTYVNGKYVLIANTNQVTLTATGSPDDDGSGIYAWSHSRGGTFSTNNCAAASTVTYFAPELAFATPPGTSDKVTVTYTYHGQSFTTNATLNILRPQTLVVNQYYVATPPSCSGTNGTSYHTVIAYDVKDQFGNAMLNTSRFYISWFETFSNFIVGRPVVASSGSLNGIQTDVVDTLPDDHPIATPGANNSVNYTHLQDDLLGTVQPSQMVTWCSSGLSSPVFKADDNYNLEGAQFWIGTYTAYCSTNPATGLRIFRGGSEITEGTIINAGN